jgi:hypothetical protein
LGLVPGLWQDAKRMNAIIPPAPQRNTRIAPAMLWRCGMLLGAVWAYYLLLAFTRRVDGDEAYFIYAAKLVLSGRVPYLDFHYPQWPLLPYVWGGLFCLTGGIHWVSARLAAAILASAMALVFMRGARHRGAQAGGLALIMLAYLTSDFGLEWAAVVKSLQPAVLLLMLAWLVLRRALAGNDPLPARRFFACGLLCGLALLSRFTLAPSLAVWFVVLLLGMLQRCGITWPRLAFWCGGVLAGVLPMLILTLRAPHPVYLSTIGFHLLQPPMPLRQLLHEHAAIFSEQVLGNPLWLLCLATLACAWRKLLRAGTLEDWLLIGLFAANVFSAIIPRRSFNQYYCLATPWLLLAAAPSLPGWLATWQAWRRRQPAMAGVTALVLVLLCAIQPYRALERRWPTWTWHSQTPEAAHEFEDRLSTIREVIRRLDRHAAPGATLLTWWPGYAIGSHTRLLDGLNDNTILRFSKYLPAKVAHAVHGMTNAEVDETIRQRRVQFVVTGNWTGAENWMGKPYYLKMLAAAGYRQVDQVGDTQIFQAP